MWAALTWQALETREPTAVAVALELILLALKVDSKVAEVWIYQLVSGW
jgi:hypothetical protein